MISTKLFYRFSSKLYDLIAVGPYANRIAKTLSHQSNFKMQILTIEQEPHVLESSLAPLSVGHTGMNCGIQLKQDNHGFSQIQRGVSVQEINANSSNIRLSNGHKYEYRNLVYSGYPTDWKHNPVSSTDGNTQHVFSDYQYENLQELFLQRGGNIVFTLPKGHSAYDNYLVFLLYSHIQQRRLKDSYGLEPLQITVICEDDKLCAQNQELNRILHQYIVKYKIKLIKNTKFAVDQNRKQITLQSSTSSPTQTISYSTLFQYARIQTPKVLSSCSIDPFSINKHTLAHTKYPNLYIVGNNLPQVYSLTGVDSASRVVARNLYYDLYGIRKRVLYDGLTAVNLWLTPDQCHYVQMDYDPTKLRKDYGRHKLGRIATALQRRMLWRKTCEMMVNEPCYKFTEITKPKEVSLLGQSLEQAIKAAKIK